MSFVPRTGFAHAGLAAGGHPSFQHTSLKVLPVANLVAVITAHNLDIGVPVHLATAFPIDNLPRRATGAVAMLTAHAVCGIHHT